MRFKLSKNECDNDIDITHNSVIVVWADSSGIIRIYRYSRHPLTKAYRNNEISISSNRIDCCRTIGLILFASLVLL